MSSIHLLLPLTLSLLLAAAPGQSDVEVLAASGALPVHIAGRFREPLAFVQAQSGEYVVLDRRAHEVFVIDAQKRAATRILEIGIARGQLFSPGTLAISPDDIIAIADGPGGEPRVQYFSLTGSLIGEFRLRDPVAPRLAIGPLVLNGVGSLQFAGRTFLLNQPETGALISELDNRGRSVRQIGPLRRTGHEADRDVHLAFNVGLPLVDPTGGFFFVFQTGAPMFRKYDATGGLVFERHIEGIEIDQDIQSLPSTWPRRDGPPGQRYPIVPPLVRTAAVDASGQLWVSLTRPYTYVYNARGDKTRTVQFRGAGVIEPQSLFFTRDGRLLVTPGCLEFTVN